MTYVADSTLATLAQLILDAAVAGIDPSERPARQLIAPGSAFAHDCDMVAVELVRQYTSRQQERNNSDRPLPGCEDCPAVRVAEYRVTLVLACFPAAEASLGNLDLPSVASITVASTRVLTNGFDAKNGVSALFRGVSRPSCEKASVGDLLPFGPSGGEAGVRFNVLIQLDH